MIALKLGEEIVLSSFEQIDSVNIISVHVDDNEDFSSLKVVAYL